MPSAFLLSGARLPLACGNINRQPEEDTGETHNGPKVPNEHPDAFLYSPSVYFQTN